MIDFSADIENCLRVLKAGGIILYPTDTVWGLGCDATNEQAVDRLFVIKQRPVNKQFILLLADQRDLMKYITQPDHALFDYLKTVHKPTTVIYDGVIGVAPNAVADDGSAAFRMVKEAFCNNLLKRFRKPVVSTSANVSGELTPLIFTDIRPSVLQQADYVVEYRRTETTVQEPSAIIRWHGNGHINIIRS